MTDEHTKGTITQAQGKLQEVLGRVTGDTQMEAHGQATQVQGAAQKLLGDLQDAVRRPRKKRSAAKKPRSGRTS